MRAGTIALALVALAVDAVPAAGPPGLATEAGAGSAPISPRGQAPAQLSGPPSHAAGPGPIGERGDGALGGMLDGRGAFAMQPAGIAAAFESLSRPQQARVMQRCRDVIAHPTQADANHLAVCEMLIARSK